jgi:hypothetical protein
MRARGKGCGEPTDPDDRRAFQSVLSDGHGSFYARGGIIFRSCAVLSARVPRLRSVRSQYAFYAFYAWWIHYLQSAV